MTFDEARKAEGLEPHPDPTIGNAPFTSAGKVYEILIMSQQPSQVTGEIKSVSLPDRQRDLGNWQSITLRMFKRGEIPSSYSFTSDHLSKAEIAHIKSLLIDIETEEDIKNVFKAAPSFVPLGIDELIGIPSQEEIEREIKEDAEEYSEDFNSKVPEAATLLEVE